MRGRLASPEISFAHDLTAQRYGEACPPPLSHRCRYPAQVLPAGPAARAPQPADRTHGGRRDADNNAGQVSKIKMSVVKYMVLQASLYIPLQKLTETDVQILDNGSGAPRLNRGSLDFGPAAVAYPGVG